MHYIALRQKNIWGDAENHYDLMHPIPPQVCKGKTYDRRSDEEQIMFEQNKRSQTKRDDDDKGYFNGPKEDQTTQRDCTAGHRPGNKVNTGRLYTHEKEE
eukprot:16438495-Heterocapsa_arctica.AAC.1